MVTRVTGQPYGRRAGRPEEGAGGALLSPGHSEAGSAASLEGSYLLSTRPPCSRLNVSRALIQAKHNPCQANLARASPIPPSLPANSPCLLCPHHPGSGEAQHRPCCFPLLGVYTALRLQALSRLSPWQALRLYASSGSPVCVPSSEKPPDFPRWTF